MSGRVGANTKAAIIRIGLAEMRRFSETFFKVDMLSCSTSHRKQSNHSDPQGVKTETFFESCGVADLIVTWFVAKFE